MLLLIAREVARPRTSEIAIAALTGMFPFTFLRRGLQDHGSGGKGRGERL